MSDDGGLLNGALSQGRANQETIQLARHHCAQMRFVECGGRGMAEAATGLPINMRRVECPYAQGGSSGNLDWIASDFYEDQCVGCLHRQPTGQVPNLATRVEERRAEAAAAVAEGERQIERQQQRWRNRLQARRALMVEADPAMSQAIADIGTVDREPGLGRTEQGSEDQDAALRRLSALADQAPQVFTPPVVDLAVRLVEDADATSLLAPLRHLGRRDTSIGRSVVVAALTTLRREPNVEAGRCINELRSHVRLDDIDEPVVHSLVVVAGGPSIDFLGRHRRSTAADSGGLRVAAELAPDLVVKILREMLPGAGPVSALILPPGAGGKDTDRPGRSDSSAEHSRTSAAAAIGSLLSSHPRVPERLVDALVRNLAVGGDRYDRQPIASVTRVLAAMLVLEIGDVPVALQGAAVSASRELRQRLFDVYEQAVRLIDPSDRWRQPEDPVVPPDGIGNIYDKLVTVCLARIGGDWGHNVGYSAAHLIADLAKTAPDQMLSRIDVLLGAFLDAIQRIDEPPVTSLEVPVISPQSPFLAGLEEYDRRQSLGATARELLSAVEEAGNIDPMKVCRAVTALIADERDAERGIDASWRLIPLLGKLGRAHGDEPRVLRVILPTLHTYLLGADAALRSAALDAWVDIASRWPVPSSLPDLLQALLDDAHVVVIGSMLRAARRLPWSEEDRVRLLFYAARVCRVVDAADQKDLLKSAMSTVRNLTRDDDELAAAGQKLVLGRASELDGYDLRDALRGDWLPEVARSAEMASLRLAQARDPQINDRFNVGDDEELCALLDCGAGLGALSVDDLTVAALDLTPEMPLAAAEFAEVAWRAGRPQDAAKVMQAVVEQTPSVPAYELKRAAARLVGDAAAFDAADLNNLASATDTLTRSLEAIPSDSTDDLARQVRTRIAIRHLLAGSEPPNVDGSRLRPTRSGRPADSSRERADRLTTAGAELAATAQRLTATATYVRAVASLCDIAAHLFRLNAAELDADSAAVQAHATASRRLAGDLIDGIAAALGDDDPLARPLTDLLRDIADVTTGSQSIELLTRCSTLPLPLLIVDGPRSRTLPSSFRHDPEEEASDDPIAVVLASIDGQLITGPQVLRPQWVYQLGLEVHPPQWPDWADYLDAELVSHLSPTEVETPIFTWLRPADEEDESTLSAEGTLVLRFGLGAGHPAPPFLLSLRWRGADDKTLTTQLIDVAGHHELRFRPFDSSRDYLTNDRPLDERLLTLYEQIRSGGYDEDHIQAFCRLFTAVSRAALAITWDKKYKEGTSVHEKVFHDDLYSRLQQEPELGGRLERGSPLALGFLDVRHDKITAELKVERRTPVTPEAAPKYMGQPTQYASADGARLSILCILDLSRKRSPIGTPENYVFTLQPALHGLTNPEAPSLVAVIIINGNNPRPSSFSRRKTLIQQ